MRDHLLGFTLDKFRQRVSDRGAGTLLRLLKISAIFFVWREKWSKDNREWFLATVDDK